MEKQEILEQSPDIPGYGGGKWAMYSVGCCWWTSFPEDLGSTGKRKMKVGPDKEHMGEVEFELPCCPHCGSVLMQAPLDKFIAEAETTPEHYGKFGLEAFFSAHSRNSNFCRSGWDWYNLRILVQKPAE